MEAEVGLSVFALFHILLPEQGQHQRVGTEASVGIVREVVLIQQYFVKAQSAVDGLAIIEPFIPGVHSLGGIAIGTEVVDIGVGGNLIPGLREGEARHYSPFGIAGAAAQNIGDQGAVVAFLLQTVPEGIGINVHFDPQGR